MGLKRNERAMSEKMHDLKKKITLLKPWNIQGKTEDRMKAVCFFFFLNSVLHFPLKIQVWPAFSRSKH